MTGDNDDQTQGIAIVRKAIQAADRQIVENSGTESSMIVGKLLEQKSMTYGWDAQGEKFADFIDAGIVDPTKVVRIALQNASRSRAADHHRSDGCGPSEERSRRRRNARRRRHGRHGRYGFLI